MAVDGALEGVDDLAGILEGDDAEGCLHLFQFVPAFSRFQIYRLDYQTVICLGIVVVQELPVSLGGLVALFLFRKHDGSVDSQTRP